MKYFISGMLKPVEAKFRDSVFQSTVGFDLHLDLIEGNHIGRFGERFELRFLYLLFYLLYLFSLFFEYRGWSWKL